MMIPAEPASRHRSAATVLIATAILPQTMFILYFLLYLITATKARNAAITIPTKTSQLTNDSGFKTTDNNTTYTLATGDSNGQIKVTPSSGSAYNVSVKGLGSAAYTNSSAYDASGSANNALAQAKAYTDSAISTQLGTIESELASI